MPEDTRFVDVPNARLRSTHNGDGPAIVFLHGGPGMWDYLAPVAAMFAGEHTTIGYDQRGCGRSTGDGPFDVATALRDLDSVRAAWGPGAASAADGAAQGTREGSPAGGIDRWTLFGHSWGASLGLAYAVAHPERTTALVYVSGTGVDPAWHDEYRANRRTRLGSAELTDDDKKRADLADPSQLPRLLAWLHADGFSVNREANRLLGQDASRALESEAFREQVSQLSTPTLILHGALDPRPPRFAEQLANLIPGAELAILPNVGHFPRFEDPGAFENAVRPFLRRVHS